MFNLQVKSGFAERAKRRISFDIFVMLSSIFSSRIIICSRYCELTNIHISVSLTCFYTHCLIMHIQLDKLTITIRNESRY